ncbi:MAG: fibronectin/fibrinogen-binding protein [Clostridiales bacterium]|nr:fibronectin/fibrinogen-binding protein [Clostridiales bacterium]
MAFDTIFIHSIIKEMGELLEGARLDKIAQPERDELIFSFHSRQGNRRLLVSASSNAPRLHFTSSPKENPQTPPMFCMLMRKHFQGARLAGITQPNEDRIACFEFDCVDELGEMSRKKIVAELMGRYSNIILVDGEGRIIDCLKRVDAEMSPTRQILPGLFYREPSPMNKLRLSECTDECVEEKILNEVEDVALDKWLLDRFSWLSPLMCREVAYRVTGSTSGRFTDLGPTLRRRLSSEISAIMMDIRGGQTAPYMILERKTDANGRESLVPEDFCYTAIRQYEGTREVKRFDSFCELLDEFYSEREAHQHIVQRSQSIVKAVEGARGRLIKKIAVQRDELITARNREHFKREGDLITANLHAISGRPSEAILTDYYSEPDKNGEYPVYTVKLDARYTPHHNAQIAYKKYQRAKNAEKMLLELIANGEREVEYLSSVLDALSRVTSVAELGEIREELYQNGYASQKWAKTATQKKKKEKLLPPLEYLSSTGMTIYAGRNNRQNEELTFKTASKNDYWVHVQHEHGSHVIIRCLGLQPDEKSLEEACIIAACNSGARKNDKVSVDYTFVRNVSRQPGGKTGMVFYTDYRTAVVLPDETTISKLRVK